MWRCCSCWFGLRHGNSTKCKYRCLVCNTDSHHGAEFHLIFASTKWWREKGHTPKASVQRRPNVAELVYLIIAGVILYRPGMAYRESVIVNMKHPAVRMFYNGGKPQVSLPDWMEDFTEKTSAAQPKPRQNQDQIEEDVTLVGPKQIHDTVPRQVVAGGDILQEAMDELFATGNVRIRKQIEDDDEEAAREERREKKFHEEGARKVEERGETSPSCES